MALKKGDFIELDFTGTDTNQEHVFDTTKEDVAKEHNIFESRISYEPITICIGEGHVLPGLDEALEGKSEEESFSVTLQPEDAFGKKKSDALKLMPKRVFEKQDVNPRPGLEVTIDNSRGTIKNVSGNRVIVDFNHPLSGHTLTYDIDVHKKITDVQKQVTTLVSNALRHTPEVTIEDKKAIVSFPIDLPEEITTQLTETILRLTAVEDVEYTKPDSKQASEQNA